MNNGPKKGTARATVETLSSSPGLKAMYQLHKDVRDRAANTGDEFIENLEERCEARYIKLSTSPDGRTYTVSIPGTGHSSSYETQVK
jgi:hypothetical protein